MTKIFRPGCLSIGPLTANQTDIVLVVIHPNKNCRNSKKCGQFHLLDVNQNALGVIKHDRRLPK